VYIANLPGKRNGDFRTKRVTTGAAEIETNKTSFSKSKRLAFLASFNPDNIAKVNEASAAKALFFARGVAWTMNT
jgi:hypothetical protein